MEDKKQEIEDTLIVTFEPDDLVVNTAFTQENHADSEDV